VNPHAKTHHLKTWPEYFKAIKDGIKTFELRKNDRDFKVGDLLVLEEIDEPDSFTGKYTGNAISVRVTYIIKGPMFGLAERWCIMAFGDPAKP